MTTLGRKQRLFDILRTGGAMCFIGHGVFGLITKAIWCNYFAVFGIGHDLAYRLMPVVGTADILFGLSLLFFPTRAVVVWLVVWGLFTACLRPLAGESFAECIERAGNFGTPAALLLLCGIGGSTLAWFRRLWGTAPGAWRFHWAKNVLQGTVFLLLAGHGWLNLIPKAGLINQYSALGFATPVMVARLAGSLELLLAVVTLLHPFRTFLLMVFIWKMGSELFYPHYELFEWIERGGSYAAILGLWLCLPPVDRQEKIAQPFTAARATER